MPSANSARDRANERNVAARLEAMWGWTFHYRGEHHPIDYWCEKDGELVAFVELKCRNVNSGRFPSAVLSSSKFLNLSLNAYLTPPHIMTLLVIRYRDCIKYIDLHSTNSHEWEWGIIRNGRQRLTNDEEAGVFIPRDAFTLAINEAPQPRIRQ